MKKIHIIFTVMCTFLQIPWSDADETNVSELSLEELGDVPVIVSGKQASRLFDAPVNSYVFGEEAIRSLPVDSIPEMLRYAPGVHIVRSSNGKWGIGIHGMNAKWFGRVPFTVDDQNVDASIFSGLFGSQHDLIFGDIASVEVVYGPGGILWDTNGGNGTVNVVMKTAFETEGDYAQVRVGSHNRAIEARTGWSIDEQAAARVYGKYQNRKTSAFAGKGGDDWETFRAGLRYDSRWSSEDLLSFTTNLHGSNLGYSSQYPRNEAELLSANPITHIQDEKMLGLNLQTKWIRQFSEDEGFSLRSWYSYSDLSSAYANFNQHVLGIEGRSRTKLMDGSELVVTGGITGSQIELKDNFAVSFNETNTLDSTGHLGAQWTKPLIEDQLALTTALSARYETLGDTLDLSPSIRLLFRPSPQERIWIGYSHSSRPLNPLVAYGQRYNEKMQPLDPATFPPLSRFHGQWLNDGNPDNEKIETIELGYRHSFNSKSEFGISVYYNQYKGLISQAYTAHGITNSPADPYLVVQINSDNVADADTYGVDMHYTHVFSENWRMNLSYAYTEGRYEDLTESDPSNPVEGLTNEYLFALMSEKAPKHVASLWLVGQLHEDWRMDLGLRYTGESGESQTENQQNDILQLDARLSWSPTEKLEVSLVGRNLLDRYTDENLLNGTISDNSEQEREFYLELTYRF